MARNATLSAAAAHGRRSADASDSGPGSEVWALRLPTHHGVVAACGWRWQGSSAADLATRRAEGAAETAGARAVMVGDGSCIRLRPERANHVWSYDFVKAMTHDGRALRILVVIDEYTRSVWHCGWRGAWKFAGDRNVADLMLVRGIPEHIRSDNGPEFIARSCEVAGESGHQDVVHRAGSPWRTGTVKVSTES